MSPLMISWLLAAALAVVQTDSLKFPLGLTIAGRDGRGAQARLVTRSRLGRPLAESRSHC